MLFCVVVVGVVVVILVVVVVVAVLLFFIFLHKNFHLKCMFTVWFHIQDQILKSLLHTCI